MRVYIRLLNSMINNVWHREKDFVNKLSPNLSFEERREEIIKNRSRYFWFLKGHKVLSFMLYYCVKKGYVERRKRTKRNYEYRRKISLQEVNKK